ncbi:MAG: RtcB family protein [Planctomycetota bacterium]
MTTGIKSSIRNEAPSVSSLEIGENLSPITVIGNELIVDSFDEICLQQAINSRKAPGISNLVLNPDAHPGYGAPVGCVMSSPTHIYPGPVGVDIKCSMSLLQTNVEAEAIESKKVRKELIKAICSRIPTGPGKGAKDVPNSRRLDERTGFEVAVHGASKNVLRKLGIPSAWAQRCEDAFHRGPDGTTHSLEARLSKLLSGNALRKFPNHVGQLGSYGGGNHFGECEIVELVQQPDRLEVAKQFGLEHNRVAFLSHCGSRGFGHTLASHQFKSLKKHFKKSGRAFPSGDPELVYAELGTEEANRYLCDMALGANYATVNHLLINQLVLEAFQQVLPGSQGRLIYFISHNIARQETDDQGNMQWVHRKGATRALPAGHTELARTDFELSGHPILLPGNPIDGSSVMVATPGASKSAYSINHGAGRAMSRNRAKRELNQEQVDGSFASNDILSNCPFYPKDEAPRAYKDFQQVLNSVEQAELACEVARLRARFVIKDSAAPDD